MANQEATKTTGTYSEVHRPQFHFSPAIGWMNDPNGMVYYAGEYHLFFQHNPGSIANPGHMHWGHAVSQDLVHWQELPVALYPDPLGDIWSGSAVVDWENTAGFQVGDEKVLVAIFTQFDAGHQVQSIALSHDRGRNWQMYDGNPVIPNPGIKDFRDPKVFWHDETKRWVMILAAGDQVHLYTSPDLRQWRFASEFGEGQGSHGGVWECPDLFELPVNGDPNHKKWVMLVSVGDGAPNGYSGTQYFIGDFDGTTFSNSFSAEQVHWFDYGRDNYAGVSFSDMTADDGRRIVMGWMNNWQYARVMPTSPWRGAMTIPRVLILTSNGSGGIRLESHPVNELQMLRGARKVEADKVLSESGGYQLSEVDNGDGLEIKAEFSIGTAKSLVVSLKHGPDEETVIGYDVTAEELYIDRRESGVVDFEESFARAIHWAPLSPANGVIKLHMFVDHSSVEVFADNGAVVLTELILPRERLSSLDFYAAGGSGRLVHMEMWQLRSIWP